MMLLSRTEATEPDMAVRLDLTLVNMVYLAYGLALLLLGYFDSG
jgi:hypothetical protein